MIAIAFVAFLNGFAIAVVLYRHYVMKPRWETESRLRKELKALRRDLYIIVHGKHSRKAVQFPTHWATETPYGLIDGSPVSEDTLKQIVDAILDNDTKQSTAVYHPEPIVPHRTHSDVLQINSIDDLIEGTK